MKKIGIILITLIIRLSITSTFYGKIYDSITTVAEMRTVIKEASENGENDVIILPGGTFDIDHTLTFIRSDNKSITFQGAGADNTILDGGGRAQIMVINSESVDRGSHTIVRGMTFRNGYSVFDENYSEGDFSKGSGGGLFIHTMGSEIKVEDVKFIGNKAQMLADPG